MNAPVSRRSVAKGAAWAVPAITVGAAAPAVAASGCVPALRISMGNHYSFGTIYPSSGGTTTQALQVGGETYVDNLPPSVTVKTVTYKFWFENRQGQTNTGPGAFWMGNRTSDKSGTCGASSCSASWSPTSGSGFSTTVTNTANNVSQIYPDGVSRPSWDLNMSWSSSKAAGTYTSDGEGCRTFDTGPSSKFVVTYSNVAALSTRDVANGKESVSSMVTVTATLSNGTVLTKTAQAVLS